MKKTLFIVLLCLIFFLIGCERNEIERCDTKYQALLEDHIVTGDPSGGVQLFEIKDLDTKCYKQLRIFIHVMNDHYETDPFPTNVRIFFGAYHEIGSGSWAFFTKNFLMEYTSELHGFAEIPIIGEKTRIAAIGYYMPAVEVKVCVAAYFVK